MGCRRAIARASCGRDLRAVPAAGIFDHGVGSRRLARVCGCSELGGVVARAKQSCHTREHDLVDAERKGIHVTLHPHKGDAPGDS